MMKSELERFNPLYGSQGCLAVTLRPEWEQAKGNGSTFLKEEAAIKLNTRFLGKGLFVKEMEEKLKVKNLQERRGRPRKK